MAYSAVPSLLQNLSRLLNDEMKLPSRVKDKIRSLSRELEFMHIFLKSSEGKRGNQIVKAVVNQIRDVAHKVEDAVDTYVAKTHMQRSRNRLSKLVHYPSQMMMLHDVDAEIERIKKSIDEIYKNKDRYGGIVEGEFQSGDDTKESLRKRRRDVEAVEVVGLEHNSSSIIKQLTETGSHRGVVSIFGMGGLGKTTLAQNVYDNEKVMELFPCRARGYVSDDYRAKELFLSLLKCLLSTSEYYDLFKKRGDGVIVSESDEEMKEKVNESLRGKKYLVVLDDVWENTVWDELKGAFPDDNNGSRILITSRIKTVASYAGTTPPYELPFLNEGESLKLFFKKVFPREDCPSDLKDLGKQLAAGCGGLPLAIIVLAGVAKQNISQREWSKIRGHINWHLDQVRILGDILRLSYDNLPESLKPCFLYLGIYPEDYEIFVKDLIKLWIAEGFIQLKEIGTSNLPEPEDVADHYLDELVDRSLVQVARRRANGGVKTCRIHDALRDLCIKEGKADKFFEVCTESNIHGISNPRRLSIHCATKSCLSSNIGNQSCTRSLFCFAGDNEYKTLTLKNFKLARILYFTGEFYFPFCNWIYRWRIISKTIPSDLKTLIHLRFLRIAFKTIPDCLYNLWNLEMLEIRSGKDIIFSSKLWKLKQLRHVRVVPPSGLRLVGMSRANGGTMSNLQTLSRVNIDPQMASLISNGSFPNLKKLGLLNPNGEYSEQLQSLHCLENLCTLKIFGKTQVLLEARFFPLNLTKITLIEAFKFNSSWMRALGQLRKLQILKMRSATHPHTFGDLHCAIAEFPSLQVFKMNYIGVETWTLEKDAMPSLQQLVIKQCPYLMKLPEELWSLATLQQVHVIYPTSALRESLQNVEPHNGCKLIIS